MSKKRPLMLQRLVSEKEPKRVSHLKRCEMCDIEVQEENWHKSSGCCGECHDESIENGDHIENATTKAEAILDAIRNTDVGWDIIIHNEDMSIFCILTVKCKEHPEKLD